MRLGLIRLISIALLLNRAWLINAVMLTTLGRSRALMAEPFNNRLVAAWLNPRHISQRHQHEGRGLIALPQLLQIMRSDGEAAAHALVGIRVVGVGYP